MHELGTVFYVIQEVEKVVEENHLTQVASVTLEVGEVSGIIPYYLTDCWKWAVEKSQYLKGAELKIETLPAVTYCEDCKQTYPTVKYAKICPHCKSEHTYLLSGNEYTNEEIAACYQPQNAQTGNAFRRSPCSTCRKTPMVFRQKARSLLRAEFVRRWRTNSTLTA